MSCLVQYGRFVKFSHTIFALPFVLATIVILSREVALKPGKIFLILLAMAAARSAAMGLNRIIDREIDAKNDRTKRRELVTGEISLWKAKVFVAVTALIFVGVSATFNLATFVGAPLILGFFYAYPFLKRVTWLAHLFLGFVIGLSPLATWLALTGTISGTAALMSLGVMCWIAGFDIIYALLDLEFDQKERLYSIPACLGVRPSLLISGTLHLLTLIFFWCAFQGSIYLLGMIFMFLVLAYEHFIVRPDDLSRVNMAFFNVNGVVSILYFAFTWLQVAIG